MPESEQKMMQDTKNMSLSVKSVDAQQQVLLRLPGIVSKSNLVAYADGSIFYSC